MTISLEKKYQNYGQLFGLFIPLYTVITKYIFFFFWGTVFEEKKAYYMIDALPITAKHERVMRPFRQGSDERVMMKYSAAEKKKKYLCCPR